MKPPIKITGIEELKSSCTARTGVFQDEAGARWGLTWSPQRKQWWVIQEATEINNWYDELPEWIATMLNFQGLEVSFY